MPMLTLKPGFSRRGAWVRKSCPADSANNRPHTGQQGAVAATVGTSRDRSFRVCCSTDALLDRIA
jgi:hypothetical protein